MTQKKITIPIAARKTYPMKKYNEIIKKHRTKGSLDTFGKVSNMKKIRPASF